MRLKKNIIALALVAALNLTAALPFDQGIQLRFPSAGGKVRLSKWQLYAGKGAEPTHGLGVMFTEQAWANNTEHVLVTANVRLTNGQYLQVSGTGRATKYAYDMLMIPTSAAVEEVEEIFVEELAGVNKYRVQ